MIYDFGNNAIDFSKVVRVSDEYGDPSNRRYPVFFLGGWKCEITCEELSREEFIELWIESKQWKE